METIKLLKFELQQKIDELAKAAELMKFFKLELQNREGNFNKMFNAAPNVGVMNPFDQKVLFHLIRNQIYNLQHKN